MKRKSSILPENRVTLTPPRTKKMAKPKGWKPKVVTGGAPGASALMDAAAKKTSSKPTMGGLSARAAANAVPDSASRKINKTSGPRAGMSYVETTDAKGRKVHDYGAEGVFVVPKKKRKGLSAP